MTSICCQLSLLVNTVLTAEWPILNEPSFHQRSHRPIVIEVLLWALVRRRRKRRIRRRQRTLWIFVKCITQHYIIFEEYNVRQLFSYFFISICGTAGVSATMENYNVKDMAITQYCIQQATGGMKEVLIRCS